MNPFRRAPPEPPATSQLKSQPNPHGFVSSLMHGFRHSGGRVMGESVTGEHVSGERVTGEQVTGEQGSAQRSAGRYRYLIKVNGRLVGPFSRRTVVGMRVRGVVHGDLAVTRSDGHMMTVRQVVADREEAAPRQALAA
jgi:hypothetical protein